MFWAALPGPGSVRHIYFHSCFKVALPAYLHCRQPQLSRDHCYASVPLSRPALLAKACWVGVRVDFSLAPQLCPLCHVELPGLPSAPGTHPLCVICNCLSFIVPASASQGLCACLSSPGPASASRDLCACLGSRAHPLHRGACVWPRLPVPGLCFTGLVCLSGLPGLTLSIARTCVLVWAQHYSHSISTGLVCACLSSLGPPYLGFNFYK